MSGYMVLLLAMVGDLICRVLPFLLVLLVLLRWGRAERVIDQLLREEESQVTGRVLALKGSLLGSALLYECTVEGQRYVALQRLGRMKRTSPKIIALQETLTAEPMQHYAVTGLATLLISLKNVNIYISSWDRGSLQGRRSSIWIKPC